MAAPAPNPKAPFQKLHIRARADHVVLEFWYAKEHEFQGTNADGTGAGGGSVIIPTGGACLADIVSKCECMLAYCLVTQGVGDERFKLHVAGLRAWMNKVCGERANATAPTDAPNDLGPDVESAGTTGVSASGNPTGPGPIPSSTADSLSFAKEYKALLKRHARDAARDAARDSARGDLRVGRGSAPRGRSPRPAKRTRSPPDQQARHKKHKKLVRFADRTPKERLKRKLFLDEAACSDGSPDEDEDVPSYDSSLYNSDSDDAGTGSGPDSASDVAGRSIF